MSIGNVNSALMAAYQYANKTQKGNAAEKTGFADTVKNFADTVKLTAEGSAADRTEQYVEYLKQRYGANVMVKNIGHDQKSIDNFGASIVGYNNVAIAPNILEKMVNDPEKAAYYEQKIQKALADFPKCQAELSMMGHELHSYAVGIDENGVVHKYLTGDLKPEVRAKIEAKIRAEQAAKRKRRERYQELSEEAVEKRRELAEWQYQKQLMSDMLQKNNLITDAYYHFLSHPQMPAAAAAYANAVSAYGGSAIGSRTL